MSAPQTVLSAYSGAPLELQRAWPRGPGHLLCEYTSTDGGAVAAQWFEQPERLEQVAAETTGEIEISEDSGVLLQHGGADRRLTALAELASDPGTRLLVHRPERRAVLRRADGSYVKVVRSGRTAPLLASNRLPAALAEAPAVRIPRVLESDERRGIVVYEALAGESLFALSGRVSMGAWRAAGEAVRALHDCQAPDATAAHTAGDEAELVRTRLAEAAAHGVLPAIDVTDALGPLLDGPPAASGLIHRDLHDKQLLHRPGEPIGLIDFDTLASGERALDLANLLVHLELRVLQGRLCGGFARRASEAFLHGYAPDAQTRARIPAYRAATRLRLAAVYAFRPRWRGLCGALVAIPGVRQESRQILG